MVSSSRCCLNHSDIFCSIFGRKKTISTVVSRAYFGIKVGDQDKQWAPHIAGKPVWSICTSGLMERDKVYSLMLQWYGETLKIITTIAISVW